MKHPIPPKSSRTLQLFFSILLEMFSHSSRLGSLSVHSGQNTFSSEFPVTRGVGIHTLSMNPRYICPQKIQAGRFVQCSSTLFWNLMAFFGSVPLNFPSDIRSWSMFIHGPCSKLQAQWSESRTSCHAHSSCGIFCGRRVKGVSLILKITTAQVEKSKMTNHKWDCFFHRDRGEHQKKKSNHHPVSFWQFPAGAYPPLKRKGGSKEKHRSHHFSQSTLVSGQLTWQSKMEQLKIHFWVYQTHWNSGWSQDQFNGVFHPLK